MSIAQTQTLADEQQIDDAVTALLDAFPPRQTKAEIFWVNNTIAVWLGSISPLVLVVSVCRQSIRKSSAKDCRLLEVQIHTHEIRLGTECADQLLSSGNSRTANKIFETIVYW